MNPSLNSLEHLRLAALREKGYTDAQIADLAATMAGIVDDIMADMEPLQTHASSAHAPANAEENVIVSIRRNGVAVPPDKKIVDIAVPTSVSELDNDSGFTTGAAVDEKIGKSGHLKSVALDALPDPKQAAENTIYYIRKNDGKLGKQYDEYQLINGAFERIGGDDVEASGFATTESVAKADDKLIRDIYTTLQATSEKYLGTGNLALFWSLLKPNLTDVESSVGKLTARTELLEMLVLNTAVTGNPYSVTFEDMEGIKAAGVWNAKDGRIEF